MPRKPALLLVVDDDPGIRTTLKRVLSRAGHQVHLLPSAEEALEFLAQHPCDLILLDLHLPGMSGLDFLRSYGGRLPAQVVVMTGYPEVESAVEALHLWAFDYLKKPLDFAELREKIDQALSLRFGEKALAQRRMSEKVEQIQEEVWRLEAHLDSLRHLAGEREDGPAARPGPALHGRLSRREREVLVLLGQGLVAKQIAAKLGISERTV